MSAKDEIIDKKEKTTGINQAQRKFTIYLTSSLDEKDFRFKSKQRQKVKLNQKRTFWNIK